MNRNQKAVIVLGIFLIILSWLFPYYEGEMRVEGQVYSKIGLGYYPIFSKPSIDYIRGLYSKERLADGWETTFGYTMNYAFLMFQLLAIIFACIGLILLFSNKQKPRQTDLQEPEKPSFYKK